MPRQPYGPNGQNLTDNFSMTRSRVQLFSTVMCISDHALPATQRLCAYALQKKNSISLPAKGRYRLFEDSEHKIFIEMDTVPALLVCCPTLQCDSNGTFQLFDRILVFSILSVEVGHSIRLSPTTGDTSSYCFHRIS